MSMASHASDSRAAPRPMTNEERKVIIASSAGTVFEWYDFYLAGSLAANIAQTFVPGDHDTAKFIVVLFGFAAGFAVRPFGALFFGRLGDLVGRKYTFLVTMTVMGLATFVVGLTDGVGMVIWGTLLQRRVQPDMLGRVSSLDFFVSLAFLPLSMALAGPLSKVISVEAIFVAAGVIPAVMAVAVLVAARMWEDELAHPM